MIDTVFNAEAPLRYCRYGRMSDEQQNPRSPDQQFDEIDRTKKRVGREQWFHVKDFRDDAISGRYKRKICCARGSPSKAARRTLFS